MFLFVGNCSGYCELVYCCGEPATICPASTLVFSHALSEVYTAGYLWTLTDWSCDLVAGIYCGRCPTHRRTRSIWLWPLTLSWSASMISETTSDFLILEIPCRITGGDDPTKQIWFSLKTLDNVQKHLHAVHIWSSFSILGTIFMQTFCMPKSSFSVLFSCPVDLRSFEQSIDDHHTLPTLPARRWSRACLLKASRSWSHLSPSRSASWNLLWHSKTCAWHNVISIHLLKHDECLWQIFSNWTKIFTFIRSVLIAKRPEKRRCK